MNKNAVSFMKERGDWEALFSYLYSRSEYDLIIELYTELKNRNEDISSSMEMYAYDAYDYKSNPESRIKIQTRRILTNNNETDIL